MLIRPVKVPRALVLFLVFAAAMPPLTARAASCKTQSEMTATQRDALSTAARTMVGEVQSGSVEALRANTLPAVAADFSGIAASVESLKPLVQQAAITVDSLYALDASTEPVGNDRTDFYCGTPVVTLNFTNLPPGSYALAILHATGVPQPQQISLILSESAGHRWMLGGFFSRPMMAAGRDGLWYWARARNFTQMNMNWNAWLYYRLAAYFLDPVDFLSSPNLEKLQHEEDRAHPDNLPDTKPLMLAVDGSVFQVTAIDTTTTFGALDLEVHYTPDNAQLAQLRDPQTARKQVTEVMTTLLALRPELQDAFHGIWVRADQGSGSAFALELPMVQIVSEAQKPAQTQSATSTIARDPTLPEVQARLDADHDPIPSLDAEESATVITASNLAPARAGEIQKRQDGVYTLHQDVDEVLLTCAVVDENGRSVTDLSRGDFHVLEDGVPQTTSSFLHRDQPVSLGIVVDNSGSMRDKRAAVNSAKLTSVVVTHDLDLMYKVADRVVVLFEGHAIYFGPVDGLAKSPHPHIQEFLAMDQV